MHDLNQQITLKTFFSYKTNKKLPISILPRKSKTGVIWDLEDGEGVYNSVDIKNAGAVSNVKFYCESSNAHYTQLQSAPHSSYSGNVTVTLPTTTGTLITTAEAQALITGTETFTATGSITAGQVVALRTDGNVEVVSASNVANWIGVSTQTVTNGNTLKVTILGGINTNLTGLTIGSVYYVQNDATISTSSGSYKIGRAIATTKLYITEGND